MTPRVQYFFSGDELVALGIQEDHPEPPVTSPPQVARDNRSSVLSAAAFILALGGTDEIRSSIEVQEDHLGPIPVVVEPRDVVQVVTAEDELPVTPVTFGLDEEIGPDLNVFLEEDVQVWFFVSDQGILSAPADEDFGVGVLPPLPEPDPVVWVVVDDEIRPTPPIPLGVDEEGLGLAPVVIEELPVVSIFAEGDERVPPPVPLNVDEADGPTLPDPEIAPLNFYSITVTEWDELISTPLDFVSIENIVLLAPTLSNVALRSPQLTNVSILPD